MIKLRIAQIYVQIGAKQTAYYVQYEVKWALFNSGLPKVIFLAVAEAEGEGGKTSALEVEAEGEAECSVFCFLVLIGCANSDIGFWKALIEIMYCKLFNPFKMWTL